MITRADRIATYRLLGGVLAEGPSHDLIAAIANDPLVGALSERLPGAVSAGLVAMRQAAVSEGAAAIRADYTALFVGPKARLTPPFESVYRTLEKRVMAGPHVEVTRFYAEHGVGFDGIGHRPADHVALELQFVATLLERETDEGDGVARKFLDEHLLTWAGAYATDLGSRAETGFWRAVAESLAGFAVSEAA